jgi:hypothetical protein
MVLLHGSRRCHGLAGDDFDLWSDWDLFPCRIYDKRGLESLVSLRSSTRCISFIRSFVPTFVTKVVANRCKWFGLRQAHLALL